jgi:hypothetical protein
MVLLTPVLGCDIIDPSGQQPEAMTGTDRLMKETKMSYATPLSFTTYDKATDKQIAYIVNLEQKRAYQGNVSVRVMDIIDRAKYNATNLENSQEYFISKVEASETIDALLSCRPIVVSTAATTLLAQIPESKYALPRKDGTGWDFFEVVQRKSGRFLNQLLGAPGDWSRKYLSPTLQAAAARAILMDPKASAIAYAKQHGRCAVCDAHLSNPESIARSMGPVCAKRFC